MAITAAANPAQLTWNRFTEVPYLPDNEDAHVDPHFDIPRLPLRRVGSDFALAATFAVSVTPRARVRQGASKTTTLLAHEQGHYDLGLLAARAMARELETLRAPSQAALATALQTCFTLHTDTRLGPIQERYDTDTSHGTVSAQQQRWESMIRAALSTSPCNSINGMSL
jgi:hypothetical protein